MEIIMLVFLIMTVIFLCVLSIYDIKTLTIPWWAAPAFGAAAAIVHFLMADVTALWILAGLIPGGVLLILSFIFRSCVGSGDGLASVACGCALGIGRETAALCAAFVFCAIFCTILLIMRRVKRSDSLAFMPFLAAAHMVMLTAEVFL